MLYKSADHKKRSSGSDDVASCSSSFSGGVGEEEDVLPDVYLKRDVAVKPTGSYPSSSGIMSVISLSNTSSSPISSQDLDARLSQSSYINEKPQSRMLPPPTQVSPRKRQAPKTNVDSEYNKRSSAYERRHAASKANAAIEKRSGSSNSDSSSSSSEADDDNDENFEILKEKKKRIMAETKASSVVKKKGSGPYKAARAQDAKFDAILAANKADHTPHYDEEALRQSQKSAAAMVDEIEKQLSMSASSQSGSLSIASTPRLASELEICPFCEEKMPLQMSRDLTNMMQYWLDQYHQKKRIGSTDTLEACQRHRNEKEIIPEGRKRGWRTELNEDLLLRRVRHKDNTFLTVMRERIKNPSSSEWFKRFIQARRKYGKGVNTIHHQLTHLEDTHAGYFGDRGWEILHKMLHEIFIKETTDPEYNLAVLASRSDQPLQTLSGPSFIDKVLMPELICMLIIDDQKARSGGKAMTVEQAKKLRDDSTEYGLAMFPSSKLSQNIKAGAQSLADSAFYDDDEDDEGDDEANDEPARDVPSPSPRKRGVKQLGRKEGKGTPTKKRRSPMKTKVDDGRAMTAQGRGGREEGGGGLTVSNGSPSSSLSRPRPRPRPRPSAGWKQEGGNTIVLEDNENVNDMFRSLTSSQESQIQHGYRHGNDSNPPTPIKYSNTAASEMTPRQLDYDRRLSNSSDAEDGGESGDSNRKQTTLVSNKKKSTTVGYEDQRKAQEGTRHWRQGRSWKD